MIFAPVPAASTLAHGRHRLLESLDYRFLHTREVRDPTHVG